MFRKWQALLAAVAVALSVGVYWLAAADTPAQRDALMKTFQAGNYKDAYEGLRKLALDPKADPALVGQDLTTALQCLQNLGRVDEIDEFREGVIAAHKSNWRLLQTAAETYQNIEHFGFIVAGQFSRGHKRGGGRWVSAMQRDRTRALQLMQQALPAAEKAQDKPAVAQFHFNFANMLLNGSGYHEPWRLQYLTDLTQLPDYEEGNHYYGGNNRGAPVDAEGNPVFHKMPASYAKAQSDGERWRWNLAMTAELAPARVNEIDMHFAGFLRSQFGVQTMAAWGYHFGAQEDKKDEKTGTFALHTLNDDETIARLATGVKRFKVPDEFNWILIYGRVAGRGKTHYGEQARDTLAQIYEDRRQYVKAAAAWKKAIEEYGPGNNGYRQQRLDQIVGNWGRFETGQMQAAGKGAFVDYRFRNGNKVSFEAWEIKVPKLLEDVKNYLKSNPGRLDWNQINVGNIGYRLVEQGQQQYLGAKVANWDLELKPRANHVDDRITVTTPLQAAGAYLLTAKMADGNVSRIIVWVNDSVILKKQLDGKVFYYVADAVSGKPVPEARVELFGWKQVQVQPNRNAWRVDTTTVNESTDEDGQLILGNDKQPTNFQWLVTATKAGAGKKGGDRLAYLGFTGVWYNRRHDPEYNATKVFPVTDRPVYRPKQSVQFKFWVRHAKYDQPDVSDFANKPYIVKINNPRGEKIFEREYTTDEFAGLAGDFPLSKDAMLGQYQIYIDRLGGGSFRVEEYKKPEFEVKVEAPKEPVRLGEKIEATIQAKYYFGAPVAKGKVKYKVTRNSYSSGWYPIGTWDWFYGKGYWWFAADYPWFPGWGDWGCRRPIPWWWHRAQNPPEIVLENELPVGADGTVKVVIDSLPAKELHGDEDHQYTITAEVTDESRRTIVGTGNVLVSRKPFQVFAWTGSGHYRAGNAITARFKAQTLDQKPVEGTGELTLFKISYNAKNEPVEEAVETWKLDTNVEGEARQQFKAAEPGQYRLSYKVTDAKKHTIEGGYVFTVRGDGFDGADFRFNDIELITDKREYKPGEKVRLMVNTNRAGAAVLLFARPTNGVYLAPTVLRLKGKSTMEEIGVTAKDMPNFFVEAVTVADGKIHSEMREVVVPPEKRIVNVEVLASKQEYLPGEKATVKVKLTDLLGKPFIGSTVLTMYDKSVEYISGGSNVPEIKEFFWKWRRHHNPHTESSLQHWFGNLMKRGEIGMNNLGVFGEQVVEEMQGGQPGGPVRLQMAGGGFGGRGAGMYMRKSANAAMPMAAPRSEAAAADGVALGRAALGDEAAKDKRDRNGGGDPGQPAGGDVQPSIRKNFADTAFWAGALTTNQEGIAEVALNMPENLTTWKLKSWAMGHGTKVGQGEVEVLTKKNLIVRLQAPRFFTQKDEVVLSANVHNYLKTEKQVSVALELEGGTLAAQGSLNQKVKIPANGEKRVDWLVKVTNEGEAVVRMKAITNQESDAMEMRFPCYVHGMLKMESFAGVLRPEDKEPGRIVLTVPAERRINETRLEVRYSPTLAGALVDALPYLVEYPYGCTEQTLNRFLPTIITQRILQKMNVNLKDIQQKRTNLNAQEIGDDQKRAQGWKRYERNPVFDEDEVKKMVAEGVNALTAMQLTDGGWGWFSGWGEQSWPHTTAVVVHGLQIAKENDVQLAAGMLERGIGWLTQYQQQQIQMIKNAPNKVFPWKQYADNLDAFVYMILTDAGLPNGEMNEFLYRDRTHLAVQAKAMYGLALHKQQAADKLPMILKNIEQFLVQDEENQTAYLRLPGDNPWWSWYGSEIEADAYYLKLLARTDPKGKVASRLVKYLLNNRKHSTYWNSTRDTATSIEAMADFLKASGEDKPEMDVEIWMDGKKHKEVHIDSKNLFSFDNKLVLLGDAVDTGKHTVEVRRKGTGPVYFNAYLSNFTLEDHITKAGLEVKVNRKYYKLTPVDKKIKVSGSRGQALDQKVEKYQRTELADMAQLKSGDLVEVELVIDSKNDYEYLIFEDPKAAGFEPMLVRSGYNPNDMNAYMELRDEKVCFFCRTLARGKHSVNYRLRAEIPGKFSAMPTIGYAMYAPELKGNSDEIKLRIAD